MKKINILIVDSIVARGHHNFNISLLNNLKKIANINILTTRNNNQLENSDIINYFPSYISRIKKNKISFRIKQFLYTRYAISFYKKNNYDILFFIAYETISMSLSMLFNDEVGKSTWLHEHNNIDEANKIFLKRKLYSLINKNCTHIVFEEYIKDFLHISYKKNSYYTNHPLKFCKSNTINEKRETNIFSPSGGNDIFLSKKLIKYCEKNKIKLNIKFHEEIHSKYVNSTNYFKDYELLLKNSTHVLLLNKFEYRISGVLYDAISYGKIIIAIKCNFTIHLKQKYPYLIYLIESIDDIDSILNQCTSSFILKNYNQFISDHSDETIYNQYRRLIYKTVEHRK